MDTILLCTLTALVILAAFPKLHDFGLSPAMLTVRAYSSVLGKWSELFFASPLTAGSITAVLLGLLLKLGIPHKRSAVLGKEEVSEFVLSCAKLWTLDRLETSVIIRDTEERADGGIVTLTLSRDRSTLLVSAGGLEKRYLLQ